MQRSAAAGQDAACILCRPVLLTPVVQQSSYWRVAINRNQNLLGKLLISLLRHEEAVNALTADEWSDLHAEIDWATGRLRVAFAPDHFNYAFLQNQDRHVHLHVIPRYASPRALAGETFSDAPIPVTTPSGQRRLSGPMSLTGLPVLLADRRLGVGPRPSALSLPGV